MELEHLLRHVLIYLKIQVFQTKILIMVDRKGVIYKGRAEDMDQWKSKHANETKASNFRRSY